MRMESNILQKMHWEDENDALGLYGKPYNKQQTLYQHP